MSNNSDQLKDCPCCGCAATFVKHSAGLHGTFGYDSWHAVSCKHCRLTIGASDRRFRDRDDAAAAWNLRRPANEALNALKGALKALEAISDEMTVGERYTNAGQYLLDSLNPARDAIAKAEGA